MLIRHKTPKLSDAVLALDPVSNGTLNKLLEMVMHSSHTKIQLNKESVVFQEPLIRLHLAIQQVFLKQFWEKDY